MPTTNTTDLQLTADRILSTARGAHRDLWMGQHKVFLAGIVDLASEQSLAVVDDCRRAGLLTFARADFVQGMDAELVAESEWQIASGVTAHFLVVS